MEKLLLLFCATSMISCAAPLWSHLEYDYRCAVTLNTTSFARTDAPLFVRLDAPPYYYISLSDISVDEIYNETILTSFVARAWAQPTGLIAEVYFSAPGVTPAGTTRTFYVYYNITNAPREYVWHTDAESLWGSYAESDYDNDGNDDLLRIESDTLALQRAWSDSTGLLRQWTRPGESLLGRLSPTWNAIDGFYTTYKLVNNTTSYPACNFEGIVVPERMHERYPAYMAQSFRFNDLPGPTNHAAEQTYRFIRGKPWCEYVLSAHMECDDCTFDTKTWNVRYLFFNAATTSFDRMVTNLRGDEAIVNDYDSDTHWTVLYDTATENSFGWYNFEPGPLRVSSSGDTIYDSYGHSAEKPLFYRYLWVVGEQKDSVVSLFRGLQAGWQVHTAEYKYINFIQPKENAYYFTGEEISCTVWTPQLPTFISGVWMRADGSSIPINFTNAPNAYTWVSGTPYEITAADPTGAWHCIVFTEHECVTQIVYKGYAEHPRLLFTTNELPSLRARRYSTHSNEWNNIISFCESFMTRTNIPLSSVTYSDDVRQYHEWLLNYALAQIMEPTRPYTNRMWEFFDTMLHYNAWDVEPMWWGNDLAHGHYLLALSLVYDWFNDSLSIEKKRDVRTRLIRYTDSFIENSRYLRSIPVLTEYDMFGNHHYINFLGVAAVAYALKGEMHEADRQFWLQRIEQCYTNTLLNLYPDGSSPEGAPYHSYGLDNLVRWLELRRNALGLTGAAPYDAHPYFKNTSLYNLYITTPGGDDNYGGVVRYGDAPQYHYHEPVYTEAPLASRLNNGYAQWLVNHSQYGMDDGWSCEMWPYLFRNPAVPEKSPDTLPNWRHFTTQGIFVWRTSWSNDAAYFSMKSGPHATGHNAPDDGTFVIHRAGVPYIAQLGYSYEKRTEDNNVLHVNGTGQHEERQGLWYRTISHAYDGELRTPVVGGMQDTNMIDFFSTVVNPTPMYTNEILNSWIREAIYIDQTYIIKDAVQTREAVPLSLFLHAYKTVDDDPTFDYRSLRTQTPWHTPSSGKWICECRDGAPSLVISDMSPNTWNAVLDDTIFVPEINYSTYEHNYDQIEFQLGGQLIRSYTGSNAVSVLAMQFSDATNALEVHSFSAAGYHGIYAQDIPSHNETWQIVWPEMNSVINARGWDVTGALAGRKYPRFTNDAAAAFFVRDATYFANSSTTFLNATQPVSLYARTEYEPTTNMSNSIRITCETNTTITVFCPYQPQFVLHDGYPIPFTYSDPYLEVELQKCDKSIVEMSPVPEPVLSLLFILLISSVIWRSCYIPPIAHSD